MSCKSTPITSVTIATLTMDPSQPGPLYTAEQITIPPSLPDILKDFTKAAIRTQPEDLLEWSAAYFKSLSKGEVPPVKARYELATTNDGGLSKGRLVTLHSQLKETVTLEELQEKWHNVGCTETKLTEILSLGDLTDDNVPWLKVLALSCTTLEHNLPAAMKMLCEILSSDLDGSDTRIKFELFSELYTYLARIDGEISDDQVQRVLSWLQTEANRFAGQVGPREFLHPNCPKLTTIFS